MNKQKRHPYLSAFIILVVIILLLSLGIKFPSSPKSEAVLQSKAEASATETYQPRIEPQVVKPPSEPIPAQLVIQFAHDTTQQERAAYIESIGGTVVQNIDSLDTVVLTVPEEIAQEPLPESPVVEQSEPDYFVAALDDISPVNDPRYAEQWALPAIGAPEAWAQLPADAAKVTVAVIDSGICASHPDLAGRIVDGWDFLESDAVPQDDFGHGCSVSGVIAANMNDGIGIAGVAPNAQVMPLRVLNASGVGSYSDVAAAIVYAADNGAQVINLSLGGSNPSTTLENAVNYAIEKGVIVVAAAGNSGTEGALYPAAYPDVIAVGSVDPDLQHSSFSNYGSQIDIWAPGRDILTTKRDGSYGLVSGTSFAAPYVAGAETIKIILGNVLSTTGTILSLYNQITETPNNPPALTETPLPTSTSAPSDTYSGDGFTINASTWFLTASRNDGFSQILEFYNHHSLDIMELRNYSDARILRAEHIYLINQENYWSSDDYTGYFDYLKSQAVGEERTSDSRYLISKMEDTIVDDRETVIQREISLTDGTITYAAYVIDEDKLYRVAVIGFDSDQEKVLDEELRTSIANFKFSSEAKPYLPVSELADPTDQDYAFLDNLKFPWRKGDKEPRRLSQDWQGHAATGFALDFGHAQGGNYVSGTDILAPYSGTAYFLNQSSYGNVITIDTGQGWWVLVAHLSSMTDQAGTVRKVNMGDRIGTLGNSGCPWGVNPDCIPHIHVEVRWGRYGAVPDVNKIQRIYGHPRDDFKWNGTWQQYFYSTNDGSTVPPQDPCAGIKNQGNVILFDNTNCGGASKTFTSPTSRNLTDSDLNFNDKTRSIHVGPGWSVRVWQNIDYRDANRCMKPEHTNGSYAFYDLSKDYYENSSLQIYSGENNGNNITSIKVYNNETCYEAPQGPSAPSLISPSADQNLPNSQNITFDWSDSGDSYTLELTGGPSATSKAGISGSSFNFGTLWPGVYQWRVIAYRNGQSAASGWRNLYIRPNAPNSIGVTTNSMYVLTINWGDSSGIDGYKLYRNGSLLETLNGGTHSYQDTGRSCGTTYSYTVRAFKGNLESDPANANGTTSDCPVGPTTPTIISPADRTVIVYPQNITFDWSDSGDTYTFYFPGGPSSTQYDVSTSSTTLNAPLAGYYEWFVVAHRNGMDSGPSAFTDLYIVPSAPGSVNVVTNSQTAVTVNWTASLGGVDGYYIYQNGTYVAEVGPNTYTYQFNNLNCDTTATYSVSAYYGLGTYNESPKTSKVGSTQPCVIGPSVPTLLSPSSGSSIPNPQSVNFDWSASGDSYIIEITGGPSAGSPSVTTDSLNFGSMWPGIYQWRVKAYRNGQWSAWSDQWTLNVPPGAPGSVSVTTNSISAVTVNWTSSLGGVDGYKVYRNGGLVTTVGGGTYSYQITGLSCEDTSTYSVVGYKGSLDSASKSANGTTAECPKVVHVLSAFTTDENGTATSLEVGPRTVEGDTQASAIKTDFNAGDGIQLFMEVENQYSTAQTAYFEWFVFDPALREVPALEWKGNLSTPSGTIYWILPTTIPTEVLTGEYTFIAAITFDGEQTWSYYDFNVTGIQSVEVISVYTTDELGAAGLDTKPASGKVNHAQIKLDDNVSSSSIKTTFNAGDPIQLYIDYYNNVSEGEIASYEWSVTDPWGRSVWDLSYSGDLDNYLFAGWWRLNRVIPANAITGTYTYTGSVTHNGRTTSKSMTFYVNGTAGPSNDGFGTPITIGSAPYAISQDTWGATVSTTDPTPTCGSGKNSNSVWYRYTASSNGLLEIDTWGSDYDTVLAVWTGTSGNLSQIACNDDAYGYFEAWLEDVPVTAGVTYYIEVMDYGYPGGGNLELYVSFAPSVSNNDFDSPVTISTNPSNLTLNAGGATKASDDPILTACNRLPGEASVWYRYTPAWDGELQLDTKGSDYDTMLAVWTGTRGNLTSIGCNDDVGDVNGEWDQDSILNVQVTAGTTYYIEASTYAGKIDVNGTSAAEAQNKPDVLKSASSNSLQEQKAEIDKNGGVITGLDDKRNNELSAQFWGGQLKLNLEYIPAPIILSSPTGSIGTNYTPTYTWNSVNSATWYYLWVNGPSGKILDKWYQASDICNGSTCSVTPGITLGAGAHTWWIQVYNSTGYGPWSSGMDFETAVPPAPGAAMLVSPSGSLADYNPTYTWNKVSDATWYYVSVSGPSNYTFTKWYDSAVVCGASTCSVTGATPNLAVGAFTWKVQTWNTVGFGPWSAIMSFSTPVPALPGAATLASPTGSIDTGNPTYIWNKVSESTWYYLSVSGPSGYAFTKWYDASVVCGASTCSVAGATPNLAGGAYTWKVQTWSSVGYGPWSSDMSFSPPAPPDAATLVSPSGTTVDHTPVYTWNDVSTSTWYYLWVNGPSGVVVKQWYSSTEAHCDGSTCWVEPTTSLAGGAHIWWIQTWDSAGYGPWSTAMNFTVSP